MASNRIGGYDDCKFLEEPSSDLKCLICLSVAKEPEQHGGGGCGKIYCKECIEEYKKTNTNCPNCRKDIVTFKDVRSERDIQSLKVKCENEQKGCEWVGELCALKDHLKTVCSYALVLCPNSCTPTPASDFFQVAEVYRKDLQTHLEQECPCRDYECPHCKETDVYEYIIGDHELFCPKMEVKCPNTPQCTASFLREDEDTHISTCPYHKIPCKYKDFGCEVMCLRDDLSDHEKDDQAHLHSAMDIVLGLKRDVYLMQQENNYQARKNTELETQLQEAVKKRNVGSLAPISFKVPAFADKKENNAQFFSPPFLTHPQGYKMTISVHANGHGEHQGTHVSVWAFLMKGEYDDHLEFPLRGTILFELLNQLENKNHHKMAYTYKGTEGESVERVVNGHSARLAQGVQAFIRHSELGFNAARRCQYLKDDCLVFRIYVQVPCYKPWLQCTTD